ncbi:MAG: acyl-CoA thioesterase [Nitrospirae bacterium]|nr:acyl-CoA thioesterase [Nitrospirota bacterium]
MLASNEQFRVRYSETDKMGIVYYSRYFEYFEIGRLSLLRAYGFPYSDMEMKYNCFLPVSETYAIYISAAKLENILTISTRVLEKPTVRIRFDYEISNEQAAILTKGYTVHPFMDGKTGKPGMPPAELMALFNANF